MVNLKKKNLIKVEFGDEKYELRPLRRNLFRTEFDNVDEMNKAILIESLASWNVQDGKKPAELNAENIGLFCKNFPERVEMLAETLLGELMERHENILKNVKRPSSTSENGVTTAAGSTAQHV